MDSVTAPGSGVTSRVAPTRRRPWDHLSPDLLLDVSNRLDDVTDFVRFHAVCTPWRHAAPLLHSPAATRPAFSPWLLAACGSHIVRSTVGLRCLSSFQEASDGSNNNMLAEPSSGAASSTGGGCRNWVASADGTAAWLFFASPEPRLVHILTGAVTQLPRFAGYDDDGMMESAHGIVYSDGTVFLYNFLYRERTSTFTAAILVPGDTKWRVMRRIWEVPAPLSSATYHDGKVLVLLGEYFWSVLTRGSSVHDFVGLRPRWSASEEIKYSRECNCVLESRGELLWASVMVERDWLHGRARGDVTSALSVTVHALEKGEGGVTRWVARDGWSLADRVLFLGSPASFAVEARQLDVCGGCVYFVYRRRVFRYSLIHEGAELVKQLPRRWGSDGAGVWLWPQPTIAPIQAIREGSGIHPS